MNAKAPHAPQPASKKLQLRVNPVTSVPGQQPTPGSGSSKNKSKTIALARVQHSYQNSNQNNGCPQPPTDLLARPQLTMNSTKNKNSQREWQALLLQQKARSTKNPKKDGQNERPVTNKPEVTTGIQLQQPKKTSFFTGNIQIAPVQELQRAISNDHAPEIRSGNILYNNQKEGGQAGGTTDARIFTCAMANKQRSQNQTVQHQQLRISKKSPTTRVTQPQQLLKGTKTISPVNIAALADSTDDDGQRSKKVIEVINIRKRYEADSLRRPDEKGVTTALRKGLHHQPENQVLNVTTAPSAQKQKQRTSSDTKVKQNIPGQQVKRTTIRSKGSSNHSTKQTKQQNSGSVGSGGNTTVTATQKTSLQHPSSLRARLASKSNEKAESARAQAPAQPVAGRGRVTNPASELLSNVARVKQTTTRVKKQTLPIFAQTKSSAPGRVAKNQPNLYLGEEMIPASSPAKISNSSTKNLVNKSFQFNSSHHTNTAGHLNESFGGSGTGSNPPPPKANKKTAGPQIKIKTSHNTQTYALAQPSQPYTCSAVADPPNGIFFQAKVDQEPGSGVRIQKVKTVRQPKQPVKELKTKRIISSGSGPRTGTGVSPKNGNSKAAPAVLNIAGPSITMQKQQTMPFSTQNIRLVNEQTQRELSNEPPQSLEKAKQVIKRPKKFNFAFKNVTQIPEDNNEGERIRKNAITESQERKTQKFKTVGDNKNTNSNASISGARKSVSAKKTSTLKQPQTKKVAKTQAELSNSVQKSTNQILLEDTRPVQNVGRGAVTTTAAECYQGVQGGSLRVMEVTQSADETVSGGAPANHQEGARGGEADRSFDMARFRMHYENRTTATSLVVAPKKLAAKKQPVRQQQQTATSTESKVASKIVKPNEEREENSSQTLAAIVSKLKMQNDNAKGRRSDVAGKNQIAQQHSSPQHTSHQQSQQSYKVKQYTSNQVVPAKVNNLSSSDFGDDSFTFSSLVHLQQKLDEHDMSGYAASQSASGNYQHKAKSKRNEAVVQKLSGELASRETDIRKLISELQNRDTVIHSLKEEMGALVDQIKQGETKREKSKERIRTLINKVEVKLQKFTHLTDLNNCQLQQLRQYDSSRKNSIEDDDDLNTIHKCLKEQSQEQVISGTLKQNAGQPVTIKLKNIRPSNLAARNTINKTPQIAPATTKSSFVAGVLSRMGDSSVTTEQDTKQLDLIASKSKENNRASTEINLGYTSLNQPNLKHSVAISKLNLQQLNLHKHSDQQLLESPCTVCEFTESQVTLPMRSMHSSTSQQQLSTGQHSIVYQHSQHQDSLECSLVTVAQCSFAEENTTTDDIIRQLERGNRPAPAKKNKPVKFADDDLCLQQASFENRSDGIESTELSLIQLEHEWERAQRDLAKQSEQVRNLLKPPQKKVEVTKTREVQTKTREVQKPSNSDAQLNNFFKDSVESDKYKRTPHMYLQLEKLSRTEKLVDLVQIDEGDNGSDYYDQMEMEGASGMTAFYLGDTGKVTSRFGGRKASETPERGDANAADTEAVIVMPGRLCNPKHVDPSLRTDQGFSKTMSKGSLQKRIQIKTPQELQALSHDAKEPAQCYGLAQKDETGGKTTKARPKHKLITRSKERSAERSLDQVTATKLVQKHKVEDVRKLSVNKPIQTIKTVVRQSKSPNDPTTKLLLLQKSFDLVQPKPDEENSPRHNRPKHFRQGGQGQGNQMSLLTSTQTQSMPPSEIQEKPKDTNALKKQMLMMAALKAQNQQRQQAGAKQGDAQKEKPGQTKLRLNILKTNANACTTAQTVKNSQNVVRLTRQLVDESTVPITGGKNTPTSRKSKHIIN